MNKAVAKAMKKEATVFTYQRISNRKGASKYRWF